MKGKNMRDQIIQELDKIKMPNGQSIVALDMVRALTIDEGHVQFVIEAPSAAVAGALESLRQQAVEAVTALAGVNKTSVILTAHSGAAEKPEPPQLKIGGHPKPQAAPMKPAGVARILAIASGKGGGRKIHRFVKFGGCFGQAGPPRGLVGCGYLWAIAAAYDGGATAPGQPGW